MKSIITAAAALLALQAPLALPANAETQCKTIEGASVCVDERAGTYELRSQSNPDVYVIGRCGGRVSWGDLSFPAVNELHIILSGPNSSLQPL